jgi:carboxyl-terminal processing protease
MKSRGIFAAAVLSAGLVSGGWFVERGLLGGQVAAARTPGGGARLYDQVFQHVEREFIDTIPDSLIYRRSVEGLLEELHDPHSVYLTADRLAKLTESTTGRYAGIGTQIDVRDRWITVVAPLPGGPAIEAGIQPGDRIVAIDGKPTYGLTADEAQKALRGVPGSRIQLSVERPGVPAKLSFDLRRREIRIHSVQHALLLPQGVGYVALNVFGEESAAQLRGAIDSLQRAGSRSLVLDLRSDPGGLLDQGVAVTDLFLDPGQRIVSLRGRSKEVDREYVDRTPQLWPRLPLVVLVDSMSASASEILAGALQDHDRAVLVGATTYGKGSAQSLFQMPAGGALKLTTALWYTPSGRSINKRRVLSDDDEPPAAPPRRPEYKTDAGRTVLGGGGITPDVVVQPVDTAQQLALERALANHIPQFRDALTEYALSLKTAGRITSPAFPVTPDMRRELLQRLRAHAVAVDTSLYNAASSFVDRLLGAEIARYVFGDEAAAERRLRADPVMLAALSLMQGASSERELLDRASSAARATKATTGPPPSRPSGR